MKLYFSPASPFVRKVLVVLHETGQGGDVELVSVTGSALYPETQPIAANPLGKIPVLTRDDGPAVADSRVICRYLDARANAGLYPAPPRLWEVLTLEALADGIGEAALAMVYEARYRPEEMRYAPWVEAQWGKVERGLDAIEARWLSHLSGRLDAAQIAVGCMLGYLDFRHGARGWRTGRPGLAAWYDSFAQRPSMLASLPPP